MAALCGGSISIDVAQAADSNAGKLNQVSGSYVLASCTNDLGLLNLADAEAQSHLTVPKDFAVSQLAEAVAVRGPMKGRSQSIGITSGTNLWNLVNYLYLVADVRNAGAEIVTIICRVEDPEYVGWHHYAESVARVGAGETTSVLVFLKRKDAPAENLRTLFPGMNTLPNGYMSHWSGLDPARVSKIVMGLESPGTNLNLELRGLRAAGVCDSASLTTAGFFPFIDAYGQFQHADWPTKIHSPKDFFAQRTAEAAALSASPRPTSWDKYGGFKDGPQLAVSGDFRVEKFSGKWWLVDPDGHLFWSHGVTGVGTGASTPVAGRKKFFTEIPATSAADGHGANWYLANLKMKYGEGAEATVAALAHDRLANWGLNTLAVWSDPKITALDKTPYTKILNLGGPKLAPTLKLPDPFDDGFARNVRHTCEAEKNFSGKDPWCIGYFIANELEWRGGPELINEVLTAPARQPGKLALLKLLQQRHPTITNLNTAWHTTYASWENILVSTNKVDAKLALEDFTVFNEELAERYYSTCESELKRATPNRLNLGSRFHTVNPIAVRAAAKHCDVVSFNKYNTSIRDLKLPDNLERPIIIGEFHFPTWDRSFAANAGGGQLAEAQRADSYWYYLSGALENPLIVGTHWFQYLDQPLTGRPDGENFSIGFVDVTDTPYNELTKVTRELGESLYSRRLQTRPTADTKKTASAKVQSALRKENRNKP